MNYFLRGTRVLTYAETALGEWAVRYHGQVAGTRGVHGKPASLPEQQARWLGPRLAREWRCCVAALGIEGGRESELACWTWDGARGEVVTVQEWAEAEGAGVAAASNER